MLNRAFWVAMLAASLLIAKDDGFAGKWLLDKKASAATCDIPDGLRQDIKKKGDEYVVETVWKEPRNGIAPLVMLGIMTTIFKLGSNGQETTNYVGPFMQVSKTTENGNQLETDWTAVVNGENVKGHWSRSLSEDGRMMTLDIQESTSDGKSGSGKLLFKRK